MNNHFHLQPHEQHNNNNMQQNVAPQFAAGTPTTYSYLTPSAAAAATAGTPQQQWLTYQILPPVNGNAVGGLPSVIGGPKRYYAANTTTAGVATTAAATTHHPSSIQITNNYTQQQPQQAASAFKGNNIRIISTAPSVYSLNKTTEQLNQLYAAPTSTTTTATGAATATAELYAPVGAYFAAATKLQPPPLVPMSNNSNHINNNSNSVANNPASTVVLDRINICINNHYAEPNLCQPSPIIPAIQHKALLPLIDSSTVDSSCSSSSSNSISNGRSSSSAVVSAAVIVIDEPDSTTTTPQTPPTTPETSSSPIKSPQSTVNCVALKQSFTSVTQSIADVAATVAVAVPAAPPTPPTPPPPAAARSPKPVSTPILAPILTPLSISYSLQEDVFIKCNDGRFYLGTIIAHSEEQYLVRFDDKSEQWCEPEELQKWGNEPNTTAIDINAPMCVACKRTQHDIVEICERCGRGYHRGCTTEIATGIWCCKRCAKPMKKQPTIATNEANTPRGICHQLPYHVSWLIAKL